MSFLTISNEIFPPETQSPSLGSMLGKTWPCWVKIEQGKFVQLFDLG